MTVPKHERPHDGLPLNQILHGDCLELMPQLPDQSIDLILADLPYGTTQNPWDSVIPLEPLWREYKRLIKPRGVIVLTAQSPFDKVLGASNLAMLRYEWIWEKGVATGFLNAKRAPLKAHENILVFYKRLPAYNPQMGQGEPYSYVSRRRHGGSNYGKQVETYSHSDGARYPRSVLRFPTERGLHPTQKPVPLFEYLIRTYTQPGAVVLDNVIGSGTTGIAALEAGRFFVGMELSREYCQLARERIEAHAFGHAPLSFAR